MQSYEELWERLSEEDRRAVLTGPDGREMWLANRTGLLPQGTAESLAKHALNMVLGWVGGRTRVLVRAGACAHWRLAQI